MLFNTLFVAMLYTPFKQGQNSFFLTHFVYQRRIHGNYTLLHNHYMQNKAHCKPAKFTKITKRRIDTLHCENWSRKTKNVLYCGRKKIVFAHIRKTLLKKFRRYRRNFLYKKGKRRAEQGRFRTPNGKVLQKIFRGRLKADKNTAKAILKAAGL